jgi:chorismate mutase
MDRQVCPPFSFLASRASIGEPKQQIAVTRLRRARLVAERSHYVQEAARFKANPAQVEASERAEAVVRKAVATAEQEGLSPKIAEATYRAMIRAFIDYEQDNFSAAVAAGKPRNLTQSKMRIFQIAHRKVAPQFVQHRRIGGVFLRQAACHRRQRLNWAPRPKQ